MADKILLAFCTFPDADTAQRIARELIELRLAACANILPELRSVYRWEGKIESAGEILTIFKLAASGYADFEAKLRALHPYDVPEIISCAVDRGLPEYLRWVSESCGREEKS
jgi:periplasmic divalent cation tolerance protein